MILHGGIVVALVFLLYRQVGHGRAFLFWVAWAFKLGMGIALGLVYQYYYSANDTWLFFQDAVKLADLARTDFQHYLQFLFTNESSVPLLPVLANTQVRSLFLVKILSLVAWIGSDNYWVCVYYFSFLSFAAAWYLYTTVARLIPDSNSASAIAFLFFPSVVFWSAGLVKETLALAGIYFIAATFLYIMKTNRVSGWQLILTGLSLWISWNLKYYWTAVLMAVVITSLIIHFLRVKIASLNKHPILGWLVLFLILSLAVSVLHPNFYPDRFLQVLVSNHQDYLKISRPDNLIHYYNLQASWWSVAINTPWALISGIFRPWLGEAGGLTGWAAAIENLVLLILVLALAFKKQWQTTSKMLLFSVLVYIFLLAVFLALSTPNLGTLSRYRVGFLPFLVFIITYRNPLLGYLTRRLPFGND